MLKTYNHEPYIAQAIDSALAQDTSFPVEILVGEDCSTDGTRAIVMSFARRYPDRIRVLAHERNVGMAGNTLALYRASRGEYVAWLDGDDYWTSTDKLQRQVDFLDAHPGYAMCCHECVAIGHGAGRRGGSRKARGARTMTLEQMLLGQPACASAYVFRKVIDEFPPWFEGLPFADFALQVLHAERGLAMVLPETLGAYRVADESAARYRFDPGPGESPREFWGRKQAIVYDTLNHYFDFRYDAVIRTALLPMSHTACRVHALTSHWPRLRSVAWSVLKTRPTLARIAVTIAGAAATGMAWLGAAGEAGRRG